MPEPTKKGRKPYLIKRIKEQIIVAIFDDDELYDALPGNGQDDYIIGLISKRIRAAKVDVE